MCHFAPPLFISVLTTLAHLTSLSFRLLSLLDRVAPGAGVWLSVSIALFASYQVFSEQIEERRRHLRKEASGDVVAVAANDLRQFGILVCDNLRHLYKRPPWLIAGQQLVPARFRLQKLPPNLVNPHGEVDMAVQLS